MDTFQLMYRRMAVTAVSALGLPVWRSQLNQYANMTINRTLLFHVNIFLLGGRVALGPKDLHRM